MRVRWSARSDVGLRREINQDSYGTEDVPFGCLLVVCDGMGGHAAGEVASRIGVDSIMHEVIALPDDDPDHALRQSFTIANQRIYSEGRGTMGTTGVAALFRRNSVYVANVGDSRAYLVRDGQIVQISRDHSLVSDQVAAGLLTPEQARTSNVRNIITRALGHQVAVDVDTFRIPLRPGDTVLLSSDGMHGLIEDPEIAEVASILPPEEAARRLVDQANERGGVDNITVIVAQVDELDQAQAGADGEAGEAISPHDVITDKLVSPEAPAVSAAPEPAERPLSRLGLLMAGLVFALLLTIGGVSLITSAPATLPTATAVPTSAPLSTATPMR
jgi:serine/threonine protein phosphatase PrpC